MSGAFEGPVQNRVQQGAVYRFASVGGGEAELTPFVGEPYPQKLRVGMGSGLAGVGGK